MVDMFGNSVNKGDEVLIASDDQLIVCTATFVTHEGIIADDEAGNGYVRTNEEFVVLE